MIGTQKEDDSEFALALSMVNDLVVQKRGKGLSEPELLIFQGTWDGLSYEAIASKSTYAVNYLHHTVAPDFWALLSEVLVGNGGRIGKRGLRSCLEQKLKLALHKSLVFGEPPVVSHFYGREAELDYLKLQILQKRLIVLVGEIGIGKTTLAAKLFNEITQGFDLFVWKSVDYGPAVEDLAASLDKLLRLQNDSTGSERSLVVLDGVEAILCGSNQRSDCILSFFFLILRLMEETRSCFVLCSRGSYIEFDTFLKSRSALVINLKGLDVTESIKILREQGLNVESDDEKIIDLIQYYRGNPLEIESLAKRIVNYFGGSIETFYKYRTTLISGRSTEALRQIFQEGLLSTFQREILLHLAQAEKMNVSEIFDTFLGKQTSEVSTLVRELEDLEGRLLIERMKNNPSCYILPPVVKKYISSERANLGKNSVARVQLPE